MGNALVVACFKVLSQNSLKIKAKNHKISKNEVCKNIRVDEHIAVLGG
jgi:hypothetical protein